MMTRTTCTLAFLASLAAAPVAAEVQLMDQLDAIRMAGSEHMMIHMLSLPGMPLQAHVAREKLLTNMGMRGEPGNLGGRSLSFSPIMTHDSNINGGFVSDGFTVAGIPFTIGREYKAVGGLVLGISGSGQARVALGHDTALELRGGGSVGYAPEHDMFKASLGGSACVNHMFDYSTYGDVCVDASYRTYDLGENTRVGAKIGMSRVMSSKVGVHEVNASVKVNRYFGSSDYTQAVASFSITSAIPGPYAISAGVQLGEKVEGVMAMRERVHIGVGFKAFKRPTSVSLSLQKNRGGMFLGNDLKDTVTTLGVSHQINKKLTVSATIAQINSSDAFFDDTKYGFNVAWRF